MESEENKKKVKAVAFIPARSGSVRVPNKNIMDIGGHPLIAYAISTAREAGVFDRVIVSTDSEEIAEVARRYGAEVPVLRPKEIAGSHSPDIEWVMHLLKHLEEEGGMPEVFSILRPTSPLRTAGTIRRAWEAFHADPEADSLRAVEKCSQHPAKMWRIEGGRMVPVMRNPDPAGTPWHSMQYPSLPETYVQNASLEIAWTRVPREGRGIAGEYIIPFVSLGDEGFDINHPEDVIVLNYLLKEGKVVLPDVRKME